MRKFFCKNVFRSFALVLVIISAMAFGISLGFATAKADVGGQNVSPGQCPYPATGPFGYDGIAEHYACDFPLEINNSRHRCLFGGVVVEMGGGVNVLVFNVQASTYVGVLEGACYWACPDGSMAEEPNPVMTWQGSNTSTAPVKRTPCKSVGPAPVIRSGPAPQPAPAPAPDAAPPPGGPTPGQQDSGPAAPVELVP